MQGATVPMLFRWSIWGNKRYLVETLPFSVGTFKRAFGDTAKYVIHTDEPAEIKALIGESAQVRAYAEYGAVLFDDCAKATWKKWCPTPRLDPTSTEFYVDSDVFLVDDPSEIRRFSSTGSQQSLLAFQEAPGSRHKVGVFYPRVIAGIPPINTGFLGQRAGMDITRELLAEYHWWQEHIPQDKREFHDDQGAVVAILSRYHVVGIVELLPQDRYCIVSPASNKDKTDLDGVVAVHATYPNHPALHRFRNKVESYMHSSRGDDARVVEGRSPYLR